MIKRESLDQFERQFNVIEIPESWDVQLSEGNSTEFIIVSILLVLYCHAGKAAMKSEICNLRNLSL